MTAPLPQDPGSTEPTDTLPLGSDALGRAWTLDLLSGNVRLVPTDLPTIAETNSAVIPMDELSLGRIARILGEGGWELAAPTAEEMVAIRTDIGPVVLYHRQEQRLLRIAHTCLWSPDAEDWQTAAERAEGVEALNRCAYFMRFEPSETAPEFTASFDVPLSAGLTRAQLLTMVRRFVAELASALDATDVREGLR